MIGYFIGAAIEAYKDTINIFIGFYCWFF